MGVKEYVAEKDNWPQDAGNRRRLRASHCVLLTKYLGDKMNIKCTGHVVCVG